MGTVTMLEKLRSLQNMIGNTPLHKIKNNEMNLYVKLEHYNFMGSIKDRAAYKIIEAAILSGKINRNSIVIEASSGNMAVALATICKVIGIKFIAVIDPNINQNYEKLLNFFAYQVVKIDVLDKNNGYLLSKLDYVREYISINQNAYWTNQYENIENFNAHYYGTAVEISKKLKQIDYIFIAVASGGTISGVSRYLKTKFPNIKVIAVDVVGSVIFGGKASPRYIPGMGSGIQPPLVNEALIDEVIYVNEKDTILACNDLLDNHSLFLGGSSGTVYSAILDYFKNKKIINKPNVVFISPDKGAAYIDNVYNEDWVNEFHKKNINKKREEQCFI
jgi:N-(2-amino-2-carboxyethyl)-L-glutamate synthase